MGEGDQTGGEVELLLVGQERGRTIGSDVCVGDILGVEADADRRLFLVSTCTEVVAEGVEQPSREGFAVFDTVDRRVGVRRTVAEMEEKVGENVFEVVGKLLLEAEGRK